jgi:hypothetical protein
VGTGVTIEQADRLAVKTAEMMFLVGCGTVLQGGSEILNMVRQTIFWIVAEGLPGTPEKQVE